MAISSIHSHSLNPRSTRTTLSTFGASTSQTTWSEFILSILLGMSAGCALEASRNTEEKDYLKAASLGALGGLAIGTPVGRNVLSNTLELLAKGIWLGSNAFYQSVSNDQRLFEKLISLNKNEKSPFFHLVVMCRKIRIETDCHQQWDRLSDQLIKNIVKLKRQSEHYGHQIAQRVLLNLHVAKESSFDIEEIESSQDNILKTKDQIETLDAYILEHEEKLKSVVRDHIRDLAQDMGLDITHCEELADFLNKKTQEMLNFWNHCKEKIADYRNQCLELFQLNNNYAEQLKLQGPEPLPNDASSMSSNSIVLPGLHKEFEKRMAYAHKDQLGLGRRCITLKKASEVQTFKEVLNRWLKHLKRESTDTKTKEIVFDIVMPGLANVMSPEDLKEMVRPIPSDKLTFLKNSFERIETRLNKNVAEATSSRAKEKAEKVLQELETLKTSFKATDQKLFDAVCVEHGGESVFHSNAGDAFFAFIKRSKSLLGDGAETFVETVRQFMPATFTVSLNPNRGDRIYGAAIDKYDDVLTALYQAFPVSMDEDLNRDQYIAVLLLSLLKPTEKQSSLVKSILHRLNNQQKIALNQTAVLLFIIEPSRHRKSYHQNKQLLTEIYKEHLTLKDMLLCPDNAAFEKEGPTYAMEKAERIGVCLGLDPVLRKKHGHILLYVGMSMAPNDAVADAKDPVHRYGKEQDETKKNKDPLVIPVRVNDWLTKQFHKPSNKVKQVLEHLNKRVWIMSVWQKLTFSFPENQTVPISKLNNKCKNLAQYRVDNQRLKDLKKKYSSQASSSMKQTFPSITDYTSGIERCLTLFEELDEKLTRLITR